MEYFSSSSNSSSSSGDIKCVISSNQISDNKTPAAVTTTSVAGSQDFSGNSCTYSGSSSERDANARSGSGCSSNMMDELSINSATNEKIKIDNNNHATTKQHHQKQNPLKQQQQPAASERPHFKIEWRQLTYYQKERSYMSKLFSRDKKKHCEVGCGASEEQQQQQPTPTGDEPKRILNSLDGCFRSGELSAILGPSGAGKSTFLSTLFGSKQDGAYGQTKVTWFDSNHQAASVERRSIRIASLPQQDHLLNHLTVYESLMFASKIKNATRPETGKNFHRQNVRRVAKMLKLTDCLDTRCGKLSGGQHKRVSIAQELLSEPDVIILDEPTSGLDAMTCLTTVQTLKSIAMKHPISIILTIHQPDIDVFNLFDHIYVIAQGGLAIYEGPPGGIVPTMERVGMPIPTSVYNPARFIVENAFVIVSNSGGGEFDMSASPKAKKLPIRTHGISDNPGCGGSDAGSDRQSSEDEEEDDDDDDNARDKQSYLRRSMQSLTEVISGKEMVSGKRRRRDKKPLLNIGIQTLDGKLITSDQLARNRDRELQIERWNLLKRLNQIQKERYRTRQDIIGPNRSSRMDDVAFNRIDMSPAPSGPVSPVNSCQTADELQQQQQQQQVGGGEERSSAKSDYSSSGWSVHRKQFTDDATNAASKVGKASSMAQIPSPDTQTINLANLMPTTKLAGRSLQTVNSHTVSHGIGSSNGDHESILSDEEAAIAAAAAASATTATPRATGEFVSVSFVNSGGELTSRRHKSQTLGSSLQEEQENLQLHKSPRTMMKRQFDKRLSAKHNCSKQKGYPIRYHAYLLAHRTWLSIVRDPIFFGIQACLHTTIPILLALIFGSTQDEGCPQIGSFDLVEFAYSDTDNMIKGTVSSIRKSIGNVGIIFFEMFVLIFSINCITALVFPLDMYVLLKEYRNGWYSLQSYLIGRTVADLPVPVILHSLAMAILYFMTGQPLSAWRFGYIVCLVILASLVAQSTGLTIGALLMKSSQSSVLAAAGFVAPFFALSGFIVRIHTLPMLAQITAKSSYLYHLLNGFIILRYGFGRCQCDEEDFEQNSAHQIPPNLHTMASMWIGTFSNEYTDSQAMLASNGGHPNINRTNVDPNIDVVDKMMTAFRMANSYGHQIQDCSDVLPYAMLDFNLRDHDIYRCFIVLIVTLIVSRFITFTAIYYKVRSFA